MCKGGSVEDDFFGRIRKVEFALLEMVKESEEIC